MKTVAYPGRPAPKSSSHRRRMFVIGLIVVAALLALGWLLIHRSNHTDPATSNTTDKASNAFDKTQHSLTDPTSIWVVVNKPHALNPINYKPADLVVPNVPLRVPGNESMQMRKVAADALEQLFAGAKQNGLNLMLASGYRSYDYQVGLYNGYVKSTGQAAADQSSARPGHSEHQTGLAVDVEPATKKCELDACFAQTPEGQWVAANAYKYGFIIRYTADKVDVTGYEYEPWHLRYIGTPLATKLHQQGVETLEEFFNVSGGQSY